MGIKVHGLNAALANLASLRKKTDDGAFDALTDVAEEIKTRSQANAPIDKGNLEQAHTVEPDARRRRVAITVGGVVSGVNVDAYALAMHEGHYTPGPCSRAKGPHTGPKYLERAVGEFGGGEAIAKAVADALEGRLK